MNDTAQGSGAVQRLRVALVDGHDVIHWGFKMMLLEEWWVECFIGAYNIDEAVDLARRYRPHVAVVDCEFKGETAQELCSRIHAESPETHVLLMSSERRSRAYARAMGATGVVPKTWRAPDIADAVRTVGLGMTVFEADREPSRLLSEREAEILMEMADGATNREIAERLGLSPHTVKDHASSLYRKLGARNRAEAILRAERLDLLGPARSAAP
jgi:DNA-binding NarL/FixJ family response regulator